MNGTTAHGNENKQASFRIYLFTTAASSVSAIIGTRPTNFNVFFVYNYNFFVDKMWITVTFTVLGRKNNE